MFRVYWKKFMVPYWTLTMSALASFVVASVAGLGAPLIIKLLIDGALENDDVTFLNLIVVSIIALYGLRAIFSYIYGYNMAKAGNLMVTRLRQDMFARLHAMDYGYFINTSTGDIVSQFTNSLWRIQQAISQGIPDVIVESLNLVIIIGIMIYFDWQLALMTFCTLPFIVLAISHFNKKIKSMGTVLENTLDKVTSILHQSLMSVTIMQSYNREEYEYAKFSVQIRQAADDFFRVQRLNALLIPLVEFLAAIGLTMIIWFGGREVINGELTIGGMFAFLVYIINIPTPVRKISEALSRMKLGMVSWDRIAAMEREPHVVVDGQQELPQAKGQVVFHQVFFAYPQGGQVLKNINLTASPGDVIAVVGPSGAGKSSFANLLLRFYDPTQGQIFLDGIDIKDLKIRSLRSHIGFIQQDPILFNASILENIRYGRPTATFSQVEQAAKLANAQEFIMELPQGYDSPVGEMGGLLSGGQRQRIAVARAIIMEPAILLLDEPTASLDSHAEKQVMSAIRNVSHGRTTFIITHRLSTLLHSDKVMYLADGKLLEFGSHAELVAQGGFYARAVECGEMGTAEDHRESKNDGGH